MSHFLDRITYFSQAHEDFAGGHPREDDFALIVVHRETD